MDPLEEIVSLHWTRPFLFLPSASMAGAMGCHSVATGGAPGLEVPCSKALSGSEKQLATPPIKSPVLVGPGGVEPATFQSQAHLSNPRATTDGATKSTAATGNVACSQTTSATALQERYRGTTTGRLTANTTRTQRRLEPIGFLLHSQLCVTDRRPEPSTR